MAQAGAEIQGFPELKKLLNSRRGSLLAHRKWNTPLLIKRGAMEERRKIIDGINKVCSSNSSSSSTAILINPDGLKKLTDLGSSFREIPGTTDVRTLRKSVFVQQKIKPFGVNCTFIVMNDACRILTRVKGLGLRVQECTVRAEMLANIGNGKAHGTYNGSWVHAYIGVGLGFVLKEPKNDFDIFGVSNSIPE